MNGPAVEFIVRRILVAADSSANSQLVLQTAVDFAAILNAELEGLFVEDIDLVRVAELSIGKEVQLATGLSRIFTPETLQTDMQTEAVMARSTLEKFAQSQRVRWSFKVVRGRVDTEVVSAARDADLLVMGTASRPIGKSRIGSTAVAAAEQIEKSILFLTGDIRNTNHILMFYNGSQNAERALDAAIRIAGKRAGSIYVVLVGADQEQLHQWKVEIGRRFSTMQLHFRFQQVNEVTTEGMCRLAQEDNSELLVLYGDKDLLDKIDHSNFLQQVHCPVLYVR